MTPFNPGNLLPFRTDRRFLRHKQAGTNRHPFGLRCPAARLMPFQLYIAGGASAVTWKLVDPADDTGATFTAMTAGDLTIKDDTDGNSWVTWGGHTNITTAIACGYWEIWVTVDGTTYYSECIHTYPTTEPAPIWRFRFNNDTDKGQVLYQVAGGPFAYSHFLYPTFFALDRPGTDRELDIRVDGNGNETTRFSRTVSRFKMEVADLPDYVLPFLAKCGDLTLIVFETVVGDSAQIITNVVFESRAQGTGLNVGIFKFDAETEAFAGCQENFELA
jgi:hypothetical protein